MFSRVAVPRLLSFSFFEDFRPTLTLPKRMSAGKSWASGPGEGHWRPFRISGGNGFWLKLKTHWPGAHEGSHGSLAFRSRRDSGGSPQFCSMNFNIEENSYWVCTIVPGTT